MSLVQLWAKLTGRGEDKTGGISDGSFQLCLHFPCSYAATEVFLCGFSMHCQEQGCPEHGSPCDHLPVTLCYTQILHFIAPGFPTCDQSVFQHAGREPTHPQTCQPHQAPSSFCQQCLGKVHPVLFARVNKKANKELFLSS